MHQRHTGIPAARQAVRCSRAAVQQRNRLLFLSFSLVFFVLLFFGVTTASHAEALSGPAMDTVAHQLASRSGVPVLLPHSMRLTDYQGKPFHYYAVVEDVGARGYAVRIQDTPDCDYMACLVGYITATKSGVPPHGEEQVALANGVHGVYTPMQLKVASDVAFWRDGVQYHFRLGTSNQQKARLIQIANAAIQNGPARSQPAGLIAAHHRTQQPGIGASPAHRA
jgi:hypothetical protein